jgi:hypothetical protein
MLDKLISRPTEADADTLKKIAGNDCPSWIDYQHIEPTPIEQVEALVSGIHGHIISIRSLLRKHKDLNISSLERDFDDISDDAMRLAVKAMQHGRKE